MADPIDTTFNSPTTKLGTTRQQQDVIQEGQRQSFKLEKQYVGKFNNGDATPNVQDVCVFECNSTVVTITNFKHGQNGQTIRLLGNTNTTIQHGTNIFTNTGADKILEANKIYVFTQVNDKWYESS